LITSAPPNDYTGCRARYPLLGRIAVSCDSESSETPPDFLSVILAILDAEFEAPLCILLPSRGEIARIAAVLLGISRFWRKFESHIRDVAENKLASGSMVCVRPQGYVYQYLGVWSEYPAFFKLRTIPRAGQNPVDRTMPLREILRLEPTTRSSPKGGREAFADMPPVPLDELLGVRTYGNQGIFSNEILFADAKEQFFDFAERTKLKRIDFAPTPAAPIGELIPLGTIRQRDGYCTDLVRLGEDAICGPPLLALTHSVEALAEYCTVAPHRSSLVVVNGASRITNLQAFDDAASMQRVVVFADHGEHAHVENLLKRGCRLWSFDGRNLVGSTSASSHSAADGVFGNVLIRGHNATAFRFDSEECSCDALEEAVRLLTNLPGRGITDPLAPEARAIKNSWGLVNCIAAIARTPSPEELVLLQRRIDDIARRVRADAVWIPQETGRALTDILEWLRLACETGSSMGSSKQEALERLLLQDSAAKILLIARAEQMEPLLLHLSATGTPSITVCTANSIPEDRTFDRVICTSWPGADSVQQIVAMYSAPALILLAYPFEVKWLRQFIARRRRSTLPNALPDVEKQRLLSQSAGTSVPWMADATASADEHGEPDPPSSARAVEEFMRAVRKGEPAHPGSAMDSASAKYVGFVGSGYAYLTDNHRVPVATQLVRTNPTPAQDLPERTVDELHVGDFIVFPGNGDKEILHDLADRMLGRKAPSLRALAARWQQSLQKSGLTAEDFQQRAEEFQVSRHIATIRNWFLAGRRIGPRSRDDLALIVLVTGDKQLDRDAEHVWNAIVDLRGMHLSAGARLRDILMQKLPSVLHKVEENGTRVELDDLGSAWIVQIEALAESAELRARGELNRLLWDSNALLDELI